MFEYAGAQAASAVKSLFSVGEASRVFWSGGEVAKTATANGMQTLEMTKAGSFMNAISPYLPRSVSSPIWNSSSKGFAEGASGEAHFSLSQLALGLEVFG